MGRLGSSEKLLAMDTGCGQKVGQLAHQIRSISIEDLEAAGPFGCGPAPRYGLGQILQ
jgi:hypothetical protein